MCFIRIKINSTFLRWNLPFLICIKKEQEHYLATLFRLSTSKPDIGIRDLLLNSRKLKCNLNRGSWRHTPIDVVHCVSLFSPHSLPLAVPWTNSGPQWMGLQLHVANSVCTLVMRVNTGTLEGLGRANYYRIIL